MKPVVYQQQEKLEQLQKQNDLLQQQLDELKRVVSMLSGK
jgi:hypothetical protein